MKLVYKAFSAAALIGLAALLFGCLTTGQTGQVSNSSTDAAYQKLGIARGSVAQREDGMRTSGAPGTYEWWYFDSTLSDGSTLVVVFYTKDNINPDSKLLPRVSLELTRPDGTKISKLVQLGADAFSASKDGCNVRIGANSFRGDLHSYTIHVSIDDVVADVQLVGEIPSWRPGTGVTEFIHNGRTNYFAWLPAVPRGKVEGTLTVAGKSEAIIGTGYHDHNWGDVSMDKLIHDWYWGRADIGGYSVIASYITASDAYGNSPYSQFMLAKDGKIIADDSSKVRFTAEDVHINSKTGKPVANKITYDYVDGSQHYRVTFSRERELLEARFVDMLTGMKHVLASVAGFDGAYLRFTGSVTVEKLEGSTVVDSASQKSAVWELMYLGHAPAGAKTN